MTLLTPPTYSQKGEDPLIFLAGPIQGARDWQYDAITSIEKRDSHILIASPRRPFGTEKDFTPTMYAEQVDWETYHLRQAGRYGVILFWLAKEAEHRCDRAYAQTTRFELAEWKVRHERDGVKIIVGLEQGYTGSKYIQRRFSQDCPDIPLFQTLEETCRAAVDAIKR